MRALEINEIEIVGGGSYGSSNPTNLNSGSSVQGVGQFVGAVTGAALCFGTPAVPFCAAAGALVGANVGGGGSTGSTVNLSDIVMA
jgi:hypothetical protein